MEQSEFLFGVLWGVALFALVVMLVTGLPNRHIVGRYVGVNDNGLCVFNNTPVAGWTDITSDSAQHCLTDIHALGYDKPIIQPACVYYQDAKTTKCN